MRVEFETFMLKNLSLNKCKNLYYEIMDKGCGYLSKKGRKIELTDNQEPNSIFVTVEDIRLAIDHFNSPIYYKEIYNEVDLVEAYDNKIGNDLIEFVFTMHRGADYELWTFKHLLN